MEALLPEQSLQVAVRVRPINNAEIGKEEVVHCEVRAS